MQDKGRAIAMARRQTWITKSVSPMTTPHISVPVSPKSLVPREMVSTPPASAVFPAVKGAADVMVSNQNDESDCAEKIDESMTPKKQKVTDNWSLGLHPVNAFHHLRSAISKHYVKEKSVHGGRLSAKNLARSLSPSRYLEECTFRARQQATEKFRMKCRSESRSMSKHLKDWDCHQQYKKYSLSKFSGSRWCPTASALRPAFVASKIRTITSRSVSHEL